VAFVERAEGDAAYWAHAHAAVAEGLCPDCGGPLASQPLTAEGGAVVPVSACAPCEAEWVSSPGAPHPIRFRSLSAIVAELGDG
jgi:hypothetical protein